jgi:hypothetical protein
VACLRQLRPTCPRLFAASLSGRGAQQVAAPAHCRITNSPRTTYCTLARYFLQVQPILLLLLGYFTTLSVSTLLHVDGATEKLQIICKDVVVTCATYYLGIFLESLWYITKNLIWTAIYCPRFEPRTSRIGVNSVFFFNSRL